MTTTVIYNKDDRTYVVQPMKCLSFENSKNLKMCVGNLVLYKKSGSSIDAQGEIVFIGSLKRCETFIDEKRKFNLKRTLDDNPRSVAEKSSKNQLAVKNARLEDNVSSRNDKIQALTKEIEDLKNLNNKLEEEKADYVKQIDEMNEDVADHFHKYEKIKQELEISEKTVSQLKLQINRQDRSESFDNSKIDSDFSDDSVGLNDLKQILLNLQTSVSFSLSVFSLILTFPHFRLICYVKNIQKPIPKS